MNIINLTVLLALVCYIAWLTFRGLRLLRETGRADSASEIWIVVSRCQRFYLWQGTICFVCAALFVGIKAALIWRGSFDSKPFTLFLFGAADGQNVYQQVGCGGIVLILVSLYCAYQHMKAKHYLRILYVFRKKLEIGD